MKKIILTAAFAVMAFGALDAQETRFGATAGFTSATVSADFDGVSVSASESGFHIGLSADIGVSDTFSVQPEALYTSVSDASFLQIPIMGKFAIGEGGFNLQAGPQINFILEETGDDFSALSFGLGGGLGYDINENFFAQARYAFQLNDSYTGDVDGLSSKTNFLNIGVGYRF